MKVAVPLCMEPMGAKCKCTFDFIQENGSLQNFNKFDFINSLNQRLYIIVVKNENYEQVIGAVALVWNCNRYELFINTVMFIDVQYS